ncbi:MAG: hypothetical protein JSS79_13815 [Bacteroidetes bacterium]|nr:hypothetical protein [Bacteroidota bacterium]
MRLKLFQKIKVTDKLLEDKIVSTLGQRQVYFVLKWTKDAPLLLYQLHYKVGSTTKDGLNGQAIKDTDGDISILLGSFNPGDSIKISFGVKPFSDIPQALVTIPQTNPIQVIGRSPENDSKSLDSFVDWEDNLTVTVK